MLSADAIPQRVKNSVSDRFENNLDETILDKIEEELDFQEKISILFLLINDFTHGFQKVYDLLQRHQKHNIYMLQEFVNECPEHWKIKLLEAICVIQNKQVIKKLGISFDKLEVLFSPKNRLYSKHLNVISKCLYLLCEALTEESIKLLLQYVKKDFAVYDKRLQDTDPLEIHMLYWMEQKFILIHSNKSANLKNLLQHIKRFEDLELIYEDLKKYNIEQDIISSKESCDTENTNNENIHLLETVTVKEEPCIISNTVQQDIKTIKRGLCIIINEMVFLGQKYETRIGSFCDCTKLLNTFKNYGFTVEVFNNLKKDEILITLESISKHFGNNYDCLFVCILSHGCKGGVISSDEKEITIETIEEKICCIELMDVIKVVVIQACQGETVGKAIHNLTTDGPSKYDDPNILRYRNFCIFMSTMQGFVSIRHKEQGSWFIQEFCNVLQNWGSKLTFLNATRKIIQSVVEKRGELQGENCVAQFPELRLCRLLTDFCLTER